MRVPTDRDRTRPLRDPRPTSPPDWPEVEVECCVCGKRGNILDAADWASTDGDNACCDDISCIKEHVAGLMVVIDRLYRKLNASRR